MRPTDDIKPITYMKMRSAELVSRVRETGRPVVITQNGEARAVVLDVKSYQRLRDASVLLQLLAQSEREIRHGRVVPQAELFARLDRRFGEPRRRSPKRKKR